MRFIHVSDVRLGLDPESEKSWGRERAKEIKETFRKVVDMASEEGCDLLLISGSLFCHQPVSAELAEVNRLFLSIPAVQVVIIAGRLDMLRGNSPVQSFRWAPNVRYVTEEGLTRLSFPALNTTVYAASCRGTEEKGLSQWMEECRGLSQEDKSAVRILLLPELPEEETGAEGQKERGKLLQELSYCALGGGGQHRELVPGKAAAPGALEPASLEESGVHGVYAGDISGVSGRLIDLRFIPMASASYIPLLAKVEPGTGNDELLGLLRKNMEERGRQNIFRLRLWGMRDPEVSFDLRSLEREFRIAEILDETEPEYDFSALFEEHPQDMIGFYISTFRKSGGQMSQLDKKAMYYGINALLKTQKKEGGQPEA